MKRKRYLLLGIVLGAAMGWALGFLRLPHLDKNNSFWVGFLASLAFVSFVLILVFVWKKNSLLTRLMGKGGSGESNGRPRSATRVYAIIWILVSLFIVSGGLASAWMIYQQNELLHQQTLTQNKKIQEQSQLIDAVRKSNVVFLTSSITENIEDEIREDGEVSEGTIRRIAALSNSFKPYQYYEGDSISEKKLSLERGQLLLDLSLMDIDSGSFARIKQRTTFSGADLRGVDLSGIDLSGIDLTKAHLGDAKLNGTNFAGADLRKVSFWGANLDSAAFFKSDMRQADLSWADMNHVTLDSVIMNGAILKNTKLINADMTGADFQWGISDGAMLNGAIMIGCDMEGTILTKANLTNANLTEANLRRVDLRDASMTNTELTNASVAEEEWIEKLEEWRVIGMAEIKNSYTVVDDTSGRIKWSEHCLAPLKK